MADVQTTPAPVATPAPASSGKDWLAFLTYFFPIVLIYTMLKHGKEPNYVWHSKNAAGAIVVSLVIQILYRVLWAVLTMPLLFMILNLLNLVLFVVMVYGGWQAANGKLPTVPLITKIGQKVPLEKWFNKAETAAAAPAAAPAQPAPAAEAPAQAAPAAPVAAPTPAAPAAPAPEAPKPAEPTPPTPPAQPQA